MWLDPFCRNLELAAQAEHEDDLPENLSEIADLWNSPTRTHVSQGRSLWPGWSPWRVVPPAVCMHDDVTLSAPANVPSSPGNFWARASSSQA